MRKTLRFFYLAALCVSSMFVGSQYAAAQEKQDEGELLFTIGCLSDLHTEYTMISCKDVNDVRLRGSIVKALDLMTTRENVDMLMFGGDYTSQVTATSQAHWEKSRQLLIDKSRSVFAPGAPATPVLYANGNHEFDASGYGNQTPHAKSYVCWDYYSTPMMTDIGMLRDEDRFDESLNNPKPGKKPTDPDRISMLAAYYYQIGGFDFVVLNTGKHLANNNDDYYYSRESVQWVGQKLEALYAEDPDRTVFFLVHIPFNDSNSLSNPNKGQPTDKALIDGKGSAVVLKEILAKYPNTIMLYGHDHGKNSSMIKERTSQRVTRYDKEGKVISSFDDTHIDADRKPGPTPEPQGVTEGAFYLHNYGNGLYFGNDGKNVTMSETAIEAYVQLIDGGLFKTTFESKYNLSCGGSGRFSLKDRISATNDQENGHWFCVEDITATPIVAKKVSSLIPGNLYVIVQNYQGYFALGNSVYSSGDAARIESVGVTINDNTVSFADIDAAKDYLYTLEALPVPVTSGSFYLHNLGNGLYFGNDGKNVTMSETPIQAEVALIDGGLFKTTFESKYNLSCGGSGRFSLKDRISATNDQENGHWFCVEDTEASPIVAKEVTAIVPGNKYVIVQYYQGHFALGNSVYSSGDNARIESVSVTINEGTVSFADFDAIKDYIYVIEPVQAEPEPEPAGPVTDGKFYLKNNANGKYLGRTSTGVGFNDSESKQYLKVSATTWKTNSFKTMLDYEGTPLYLDCGGSGNYNLKNSSYDNEQNNGFWYCIDDITAATITANKAAALEVGKSYLIVHAYSGVSYALGNAAATSSSGEPRVGSVAVDASGDVITMSKDKLENCIYTLEEYKEEPVPEENGSFFSIYLGSCRYYDNDIDGGWTQANYEKDPKVIQGLMIYIYSNRIEFHMKNYGSEFGNVTKRDDNKTLSGITISENLVPYIVYRDVRRHTGHEPEPVPTYINKIPENQSGLFYNVYGMPVDESYRGIVIDGATGQKYLKR